MGIRDVSVEYAVGGDVSATPGMKGRRRAGSGVSLSGTVGLGPSTSASSNFAGLGRTSSTGPTVRTQPRHRTISLASSGQSTFVGPGSLAPSASTHSIGPFLSLLVIGKLADESGEGDQIAFGRDISSHHCPSDRRRAGGLDIFRATVCDIASPNVITFSAVNASQKCSPDTR